MLEDLLEWSVRLIGRVLHALSNEHAKQQLEESVADSITEAVSDKIGRKDSKAHAEKDRNAKEDVFLDYKIIDTARGAFQFSVYAIVAIVLFDVVNLYDLRIFRDGHIIYLFQYGIFFFFMVFVPGVIIRLLRSIFLMAKSNGVRDWSCYLTAFVIANGVFWIVVTYIFPSMGELLTYARPISDRLHELLKEVWQRI